MTTMTPGRFGGRRGLLRLGAVLAAGLSIRLLLAARTSGNVFDLASLRLVEARLHRPHITSLYTDVNGSRQFLRWPYPPGYFAPLLLVGKISRATGVELTRLVRVVPSIADLLLAVLAFLHLSRRAEPRLALAGAALIALGPTFFANSGHHGQLDSVAVLPVVAAVIVWDRGWQHRALVAGALLGAGASVKTFPVFFCLALLATARDRREGATLLAIAAAIPAALLLPFVLADEHGVVHALSYRGLPGLGGTSMLVQPSLARDWLALGPVELSRASELLATLTPVLLVVGLAGTFVLLRRRRVGAPEAAIAVALVLLVLGGNFALGYAIWLLPLLVLAGRLLYAAVLQALLVVPTLIIYLAPAAHGISSVVVYSVYVPLLTVVWALFVAGWVRILQDRPPFGPAQERAGRGSA
jgi:hypothetical protein